MPGSSLTSPVDKAWCLLGLVGSDFGWTLWKIIYIEIDLNPQCAGEETSALTTLLQPYTNTIKSYTEANFTICRYILYFYTNVLPII